MKLLAALAVIGAALPAGASGLSPAKVVAMTAADDKVCELLKSDRGDRCASLAHADAATVYQAGTPGLRRIVLAIDTGEATVVSPSIDLATDGDAQLIAATPTMHAVQLDGRPGMVLDVVASFKTDRDKWQTESIVGCGQTAAGAWKCAEVDVGRCAATIDGKAQVTTACGDREQLSLR